MTIREDILQLLHRAMWAIDTRNVEAYTNCFTEEAVFTDVGVDGTVFELRGNEAIRIDAMTRFSTPSLKQHRVDNPIFVEDGEDHVTVHSYWSTSVLDEHEGTFRIGSSGTLVDEVVRENNEWRIAHHFVRLWRPGMPFPHLAGATR